MISVNAIWIFSLAGLLLAAVAIFAITIIRFGLGIEKFSFLRNFPYELVQTNDKAISIIKTLLYIETAFAFSPLFFITPLINEFGSLGFFCIFISCVFGLSSICNCLLFFFDARYTKTHIVLVTLSMALCLLANALVITLNSIVLKEYTSVGNKHILSVICIIFSGLLTIGMLVLMINPKLKKWANLTSEGEQEERVYSRGKVFILALSEWLTILISILGELLFFISVLK